MAVDFLQARLRAPRELGPVRTGVLERVRMVIFDFGWTLADFAGVRSWRDTVASAVADLRDALENAVTAGSASEYERGVLAAVGSMAIVNGQPIEIDAVWAEISRRFGPYSKNARSAAVESFGAALTRDWKPYRESLPVLDVLSRRNYRLGLVSDVASPARHWEAMVQGFGFSHYIKATAFSEELGLTKPDPAGLELVMRTAGMRPEQCVFVGDTPHKDIDGAIAAGIAPVWIRRRADAELGERRPVLTVANLGELLGHLPGAG